MSTIPIKPRTITGDREQLEDAAARESQPVIVTSPDVDDLALLPKLLRLVAGELHDLAAVVRTQVVPAIKRLGERQIEDTQHTDQQINRLHARLDEIQTQIASSR